MPNRTRTRTRSRLSTLIVAAPLALASLALAGCGDDDDPVEAAATAATTAPPSTAAATAASTTYPVTVEADNGPVTLDAQPTRIVSLSPTATEMLFAIDAGSQVVAVDDQSDFPADVPVTDLSGFEPNVEAVAGYEPDLVVLANDTAGVVDGLTALDIPVALLGAATVLDDTYDQIDLLGVATGHPDEAADLVRGMQEELRTLVAEVPEREVPLRYYHELDDLYFSATSATFIGSIYGLAGLENIADAADAGGASGGYPQLSAEYIVAEDPAVIFLADVQCCGQSAATVTARPGWEQISAVQSGSIVELDDDIASRWGPRVVDLLRTVVVATAAADAVTATTAP